MLAPLLASHAFTQEKFVAFSLQGKQSYYILLSALPGFNVWRLNALQQVDRRSVNRHPCRDGIEPYRGIIECVVRKDKRAAKV